MHDREWRCVVSSWGPSVVGGKRTLRHAPPHAPHPHGGSLPVSLPCRLPKAYNRSSIKIDLTPKSTRVYMDVDAGAIERSKTMVIKMSQDRVLASSESSTVEQFRSSPPSRLHHNRLLRIRWTSYCSRL